MYRNYYNNLLLLLLLITSHILIYLWSFCCCMDKTNVKVSQRALGNHGGISH